MGRKIKITLTEYSEEEGDARRSRLRATTLNSITFIIII
jgi:hypothetical protein